MTLEEMEEVNQESKNIKADSGTLERSQTWEAEVCLRAWEMVRNLPVMYLARKKWK